MPSTKQMLERLKTHLNLGSASQDRLRMNVNVHINDSLAGAKKLDGTNSTLSLFVTMKEPSARRWNM